MKKPQFAERQYEAAAHIELARGQASPFVPTQTIEFYIGIDAAADPIKAHAIWRILSIQVPRRVQLYPGLWPALPRQFHDEIPGRFCSLFMQFKRPVFQDSKRARYHLQLGGPYFEVRITPHQQSTLSELQNRVGKLAVVRYASPAFWSRADFDLYDEQRRVLVNSAFIPPHRVKKHKKWMYSGISRKSLLNPDPEDVDSEAWENVLRELGEQATRLSLRDHIRSLARAIRGSEELHALPAEPSWLRRLAPYGHFSREDNAILLDLSTIALAAENADSTWIVLLLPDDNWKGSFTDVHSWWNFLHRWWP